MASPPKTMQALVWRGSPEPRDMRLETLRTPVPKPGEVLVKVRACGVCRSDVHWMKRGGCEPPCVPGHEISGEVAALGEGVHDLEVGRKVVGCFIQPCGDCCFCRLGEEDGCEGIYADNAKCWLTSDKTEEPVKVNGGFGGMAEYVTVKRSGVYPLPKELYSLWGESSILGCAYFTAMGAVKNGGRVQPGQSVVVVGCGGVGACVIQCAKYMGAHPIIAVDISDKVLSLTMQMGADHIVNSSSEDVARRVAELTGGIKADVSFEVIGSKATFELAMLKTTRAGGKAVYVGIAHPSEVANLPMQHFVRSRISLVASYGGRPSSDMPELLAAIASGKIDLQSAVTKEFALRDAGEAYSLLADGKLQGRAIVNCSSSSTPHRLLIGGELVEAEGGRCCPVINPASGAVFTQVPDATVGDAARAVAAADAAYRTWSRTPFVQRAACLLAFSDKLEKRATELAEALTRDQGKPIAQSLSETSRVIKMLREVAKIGDLPPESVPGNSDVQVQYVSRGVVVGIQPWNFPLAMAVKQLAPALATGNTIVLKPSPYTPLTALMLGSVAKDAFPAGVVNVISGGDSIGQELIQHPRVRHVTFTGSIPTGRRIMNTCSATLKKVTLELGGNDPAIILPGADVRKIAPDIFDNFSFNSGQVCTAIKRLYVHESQYDDMVKQLADLATTATSKIGDGMKESTSFGPINNRMQLERIEDLVGDARRIGAKVVVGGQRAFPADSPGGFFYEPTVVADIADDARLVTEEQFGPVLPVLKYSDVTDALQRANKSEYGLGGSVWGPDEEAAEVLSRLECGIAWLNCHNAGNMHTPWGAVKQSGLGAGGDATPYSLKEYAEAKTTWIRSPGSEETVTSPTNGHSPQNQDMLSGDCTGLSYSAEKISADRSCHKLNSREAVADPSPAEQKFVDFVLNHEPSEKAVWRAKIAILDTCSITAAGHGFPSSEILKNYAKQEHGGSGGKLLFGDGEVSRTGAAFAFAQQCECVDAHDGLNRQNAHISATLLPAMFVFAGNNETKRTGIDFVKAYAVGLEAFAYCAESVEVEEGRGYIYLPGGLKAGFGAVAGLGRFLNLDALTLRHALGIYELQAPRVQTHGGLRCTIWPSMLRDTMAWAAHAAVSAIQLAQLGFTGIPCGFFKLKSFEQAMLRPPTMLSFPGLYIKSYSACRWAHAYVNILRYVLDKNNLVGDDVESCHVLAERGGAALGEGVDFSVNVDEAHYDLKWPLAAQIVEWPQIFSIRLTNPTSMHREDIRAMCKKITVEFDNTKSNMSFSRELSVRMKSGAVHRGTVEEVLAHGGALGVSGARGDSAEKVEARSHQEYLLNAARDDQYMGVMTEDEFRKKKYQPFCTYGAGEKRAAEIWTSVEQMAAGGSIVPFVSAMTRPLNVDRDEVGGAVDKDGDEPVLKKPRLVATNGSNGAEKPPEE